MRVPITFDQPLGRLVDELELQGTKRRVVKALMESFLCEDTSSFKESISTATASDTKSLLFDVRELLCWSQVEHDPNALRISVGSKSLPEILDSDEVSKALISISEPLRRGNSRQTCFDAKFSNALKRARRVEIIDAYAATNLQNQASGTTWFLRQTLEKFDGVISIYSTDPRLIKTNTFHGNSSLGPLEQNLSRLLTSLHTFRGELRLTLVAPKDMPHNRRIALRFDSGQATAVLEKGLAMFDSDPFSESHEMANADLTEFKKAIKVLSSARNKSELVHRHSDTCSDCATR